MGSLLRFPGVRAASQQYVSELKSIYGTNWEILDPDYALASDMEIYDKLERDPVIFHSLQTRFHSVASGPWHMEPKAEDEKHKIVAAIMEELVGEIRDFGQARYLLCRGALLGGRGYSYVSGEKSRRAFEGGPKLNWWVPKGMQDIDKRRLRWKPDRNDDGKPFQYLTYAPLGETQFEPVAQDALQALVQLTYLNREDRMGHGQGLGTPIYHYFYAKAQVWRDLLQGIARWAQGIIAWKIGDERLGTTDKSNDEIVEDALEVTRRMRAENALVYGSSDEMAVHESSGVGNQMCMDAIEHIDRALIRLILGSVRPSGGDTDTGARAQAETEQEETDILIRYDRQLLDEALTQHLVSLVWRLNRPNFVAMGLGDAEMPKFVTSVERNEDPQVIATQVETLLRAGVSLAKDEVYERTGWRAPAKDEEVFDAPEQPDPFGGGGEPPPFNREPAAQFFDESKVKRDGGKFAPKEGAGAKDDETGSDPKLPQQVKGERRHAPAGGMIGLNGSHYKGGWFLPSSKDTEQGKHSKDKVKGVKKGKKGQIAPGVWEVTPGKGFRPVYPMIEGRWLRYDKETDTLKKWTDEEIQQSMGDPHATWEDKVAVQYEAGGQDPLSKEELDAEFEKIETMMDGYNRGGKWIKADMEGGKIEFNDPTVKEAKDAGLLDDDSEIDLAAIAAQQAEDAAVERQEFKR